MTISFEPKFQIGQLVQCVSQVAAAKLLNKNDRFLGNNTTNQVWQVLFIVSDTCYAGTQVKYMVRCSGVPGSVTEPMMANECELVEFVPPEPLKEKE